MIETRKLTEDEFDQLISDAPESETRFIRKKPYPYIWLNSVALENLGIVINGKPIYLGAIVKNRHTHQPELWTVVNSNVKEQFTLFKISKRVIHNWLNKYHCIFATMYKDCDKNLKWTQRLGFRKINDGLDTVTLVIGG